jgi:hypothetical protein
MLGAASSGFAQGEPASAERPQAFGVRREGGRMRFAEEVELRLLLFAAAETEPPG